MTGTVGDGVAVAHPPSRPHAGPIDPLLCHRLDCGTIVRLPATEKTVDEDPA